MTTGKIEAARPSKSGKTLGIKVGGKWYSTDMWEMQEMVGETITITEHNHVDFEGGGGMTYLNAYELGAGKQEYQPPTLTPMGGPALGDNARLLDFVGRCMMGFPWQTSDLVVAKTRMQQCYELGQKILDGSIMTPETAPRRRAANDDPPAMPPAPPEDEFDDDIPF